MSRVLLANQFPLVGVNLDSEHSGNHTGAEILASDCAIASAYMNCSLHYQDKLQDVRMEHSPAIKVLGVRVDGSWT